MKHLPRTAVRAIYMFVCVLLLAGNILYTYAAPDGVLGFSAPVSVEVQPESQEQAPKTLDDESGQLLSEPLPPCETQEQLQTLLEQNSSGTVTLTGNIEWRDFGGLYADNPTKIEMSEYSIVAYGYMILGNGLSFEGKGEANPLFIVMDGGYLNMGDVSVTSTGDRAVTLRLESGANLYSEPNTRIAALGSGAVAIDSAGGARLQGGYIEAFGRDSIGIQAAGEVSIESTLIYAGGTGIRASGNVRAFYCVIEGGDAAIVSESGVIALDCAKASPPPKDASIISRIAVPYGWYHIARYGFCVTPGQYPALISPIEYYLVNTDDPEDIETMYLQVGWETGNCDMNTPGTYRLYVTALDTLVDIEGFSRSETPLYVVGQSAPWLVRPEWLGSSCEIIFFNPAGLADAQEIRLLYSEDEGKSWHDAEKDFSGFMTGSGMALSGMDGKKIYWFRLTVVGGSLDGESNILEVCGDPFASTGDNRDGGDREGADSLPPVTGADTSEPKETSGNAAAVSGQSSKGENEDADGGQTDKGSSDRNEIHAYAQSPEALESEPVLAVAESDGLPSLTGVPSRTNYPDGSLYYSADEMADMISVNSQRLVFISDGIKVAIPTGALAAALDGEPDFAIWLARPADTRFAIRMFAGGNELSGLGGEKFQVYIPYDIGGSVICTDESGGGVSVSLEAGTAVCSLTRTGSYTLSAAAAGAPGQNDAQPVQGDIYPVQDKIYAAPDADRAAAEPSADSRGLPRIWIFLPACVGIAAIGLFAARLFRRGRPDG